MDAPTKPRTPLEMATTILEFSRSLSDNEYTVNDALHLALQISVADSSFARRQPVQP